jgi:hypothetical protein
MNFSVPSTANVDFCDFNVSRTFGRSEDFWEFCKSEKRVEFFSHSHGNLIIQAMSLWILCFVLSFRRLALLLFLLLCIWRIGHFMTRTRGPDKNNLVSPVPNVTSQSMLALASLSEHLQQWRSDHVVGADRNHPMRTFAMPMFCSVVKLCVTQRIAREFDLQCGPWNSYALRFL